MKLSITYALMSIRSFLSYSLTQKALELCSAIDDHYFVLTERYRSLFEFGYG